MTSSLFRYVRNASGVTPATRPEMNNTAGPPGSLDLKQWPSGRNSYNFADSFADYGRWMELWAHTARAAEAEMQAGGGGGSGGAGATFVRETWPLIQGMCKYTFMLHDVALAAKQARPATGLIVGPAEHDTCSSEAAFFSINAWTWRGWVEISRFLNDVASSPSASGIDPASAAAFKSTLDGRIAVLAAALNAAADASLVLNPTTGKAFFMPPWAFRNYTPYNSMNDDGYAGGAPYSNFRYYAEMLSSGFFSTTIETAINDFREAKTGTLSGMTRFRDHLDDMPAEGYAHSAIALNRTRSYQTLLFGHMANYQSRGVFNSPEQLSLYGDGTKGKYTYSDSYRAYLSAGHTEIDIDFCVPSTMLTAIMLRWMMCYEERDLDRIALLRTAPRRFFRPTAAGGSVPAVVEIAGATTRYGRVDANVSVTAAAPAHGAARGGNSSHGKGGGASLCPESALASIAIHLHGKGFVTPMVSPAASRIRAGTTTANNHGGGGGGTRTLEVEVRLRTYGLCEPAVQLASATAALDGSAVQGSRIIVDVLTETVTVMINVAVTEEVLQTVLLEIKGNYTTVPQLRS